MTSKTTASPEALLEHGTWLRALARTLVGDAALADDLTQETWAAALRRPPDGDRDVRPWLGTVLRNVARFRWRGDANRAARERAAAAGAEAEVPSSEALLERHQTQQLLARLVSELDEPYRGTVLLRFGEGLTPAQIARRQGIPAGTVRWRLKEALERLRVRLDAEHRGDRRAWVLALVPIARLAPPSTAGASASPYVLLAGAAALVVAVALAISFVVAVRGGEGGTAGTGGRGDAAARRRGGAALHGGTANARAGEGGAAAGDWYAGDAPARTIHGRVRFAGAPDGTPAAGVIVRLASDLTETGVAPVREVRTDAGGRFDFGPQSARPYVVSSAAPGRLAAIAHLDLRDPTTGGELELVLTACPASLHGTVGDAAGNPIAGAELLREGVIGTSTDAAGQYELCLPANASTIERLEVVVRAEGYGAIAVHAAPAGRWRRDFVLVPESAVSGRVTVAGSAPAAGMKLRIEPDIDETEPPNQRAAALATITDADGRFRIVGLAAGRHRISGADRAAVVEPVDLRVTPGETREVELVAVAAGTLRGRVQHAGQPVAGVRVAELVPRWLARPADDERAAFSQTDGSFELALPAGERMLATVPHALREPVTVSIVAGGVTEVVLDVEPQAVVRGTVRVRGVPVPFALVMLHGRTEYPGTADAAGRYELTGVQAGAYEVYADDTRLAASVAGVPLEVTGAGEHVLDLELTDVASIAGVVVDPRGAPVEGALVRFRGADGRGSRVVNRRCATGSGGAFVCGSLRAGLTYAAAVYATDAASQPLRAITEAPDAEPTFDIPAGTERVDNVRLIVDPVVLAIAGRVTDSDGAPVADALVSAFGDSVRWSTRQEPSAVTDADGAFRIPDLAPGTYQLAVRPSDRNGETRRTAVAGATDVSLVVARPVCDAPDVHTEPAGLTRPEAPVVWNRQIELVGWRLPPAVRRGEPFELTLVYRALATIDRPWKIFVHIDGAQHRHNGDHEPAAGRCPTSTWTAGTLIVDRFTSTIDAALAPGVYTVRVGLFAGWAQRFRNLPVSAAPASRRGTPDKFPDSIRLTTLAVD